MSQILTQANVNKDTTNSIVTTSTDTASPFFEPKLRIADWDTDILTEDDSTILIDTTDFKNKRLSVLECDPKIPILFFTGQLYQEIRYMTELHPHCEWSVFLTLKRISNLKPHFLAFDWFMPVQEVSGGAVSINAQSAMRYYDYLKSHYEYYQKNGLHRYLCHLHSHHSLDMASFSSVDDAQQFGRDDLGFMDDYRMYIVVTLNSGIKASLVIYKPVATRVDLAIGVTYANPDFVASLTKQRKEEITDIMRQCMCKTSAVTSTIDTSSNYNSLSYYRLQEEMNNYTNEHTDTNTHNKNSIIAYKGVYTHGVQRFFSQSDFKIVMTLMSMVSKELLQINYNSTTRRTRDILTDVHTFEDYFGVKIEGDTILMRYVSNIIEMSEAIEADLESILQVILELCIVYHAAKYNNRSEELSQLMYLSGDYIDEVFLHCGEGKLEIVSDGLVAATVEEFETIFFISE